MPEVMSDQPPPTCFNPLPGGFDLVFRSLWPAETLNRFFAPGFQKPAVSHSGVQHLGLQPLQVLFVGGNDDGGQALGLAGVFK